MKGYCLCAVHFEYSKGRGELSRGFVGLSRERGMTAARALAHLAHLSRAKTRKGISISFARTQPLCLARAERPAAPIHAARERLAFSGMPDANARHSSQRLIGDCHGKNPRRSRRCSTKATCHPAAARDARLKATAGCHDYPKSAARIERVALASRGKQSARCATRSCWIGIGIRRRDWQHDCESCANSLAALKPNTPLMLVYHAFDNRES